MVGTVDETSLKRETRQGHKESEKSRVFQMLEEIGVSLRINPRVIERAQTLFAQYRQKNNVVRNRERVACASMILAQREMIERTREESAERARVNAAAEASSSSSSSLSSTSSIGGNKSGGGETGKRLSFACPRCKVEFSDKKSQRIHACLGGSTAGNANNGVSAAASYSGGGGGDPSKRMRM